MKKKKETDSPICEKCKGRTSLVSGQFYYDPDREPYLNGKEEASLITSGDCHVIGYVCDNCGHIQGLFHE